MILLVDMDSFFSSIEVVEHPELAGLSVVVGADPKEGSGRGVVSTCSYEARGYGIHSGMPISRAYRLCPDARFLPVNMPLYQSVSGRIMKVLRRYADKFQKVSIDEAFLDITTDNFEDAVRIAQNIKEEILDKEKLTCSIGIGPNKLVAKIASDIRKPDGLTIVRPDEVRDFLDPMPAKRIPGIGKKTEKTLKSMEIETIRELREYDVKELVLRFGKWGYQMHALAYGIDEREVKEDSAVKSIGREVTFEEDTSDSGVIHDSIDILADETHTALVKAGYLFRTVSVKVRFEDFDTHTRAKSIGFLSSDPELIKNLSKKLIDEFIGKKKIRLIGVRLSNLQRVTMRQTSLYEFIR
ncbi:MAG: DNA polymerase IV [Euryarchaeota archaeon]|nr:DNA polymerase IV [Euryarchaeota archaeon]